MSVHTTEVDLRDRALLTGGSARLSGTLARPGGGGPWPGVVVIHEALGADDVMRRHTERMAEAGYLTLMPDLFSDGGVRSCLVTTFRDLLRGKGKAFADIEAARRELVADPDCTGQVGVIGFCLGGAFALVVAGTGRYDVSSANYGRPAADLDALLQDSCPLVASYGGRDLAMRGVADQLEKVLTRHGIDHDVKEYPNAGHCFLNDAENAPVWSRPITRIANIGPHPASAQDAWQRIETFFARHLHG